MLLLLAAWLLRLLVPAGCMSGGSATALGLKLCPGAQAGSAGATHGPHHQHQGHDPQQHAPCLFSAGATAAPLTAAPVAVLARRPRPPPEGDSPLISSAPMRGRTRACL